ncbi:hypothetical protein TWF281_007980 [Arthrobotrys megalospora]
MVVGLNNRRKIYQPSMSESGRTCPCTAQFRIDTRKTYHLLSSLVPLISPDVLGQAHYEAVHDLYTVLEKCIDVDSPLLGLCFINHLKVTPDIEALATRMRVVFDGHNAYSLENMLLVPQVLRNRITSIYFSSNNTAAVRPYSDDIPPNRVSFRPDIPFWEPLDLLTNGKSPLRPLWGHAIVYKPELIKKLFPRLKCMAIAAAIDGYVQPSPLYVGLNLMLHGLERLEVVFQGPGYGRRERLWAQLLEMLRLRASITPVENGNFVSDPQFTLREETGAINFQTSPEDIDVPFFKVVLEKLSEEELQGRVRHMRLCKPGEGPYIMLEEFEVWAWKILPMELDS